jgi:hypothetical protein
VKNELVLQGFAEAIIPELSNRCEGEAVPSPAFPGASAKSPWGITDAGKYARQLELVRDECRVQADGGPVDRRMMGQLSPQIFTAAVQTT